jgi:hypothetical protein
MRHPRRAIILLALGAVITVVATATLLRRGVTADIHNTGATPLLNLRVHVTGRAYPLGDLQPGQSRAVRVDPTGESHLTLAYTDPAGAPRSLTADCYFESGYRGRITVDIANGKVTRVDSRVHPY